MKQKLKKGDACTLNFRTPPLDFPHCNIESNIIQQGIANQVVYAKRHYYLLTPC